MNTRYLPIFNAVVMLLLLAACAPYQPRVEVQAAPGFDAAGLATWNFIEPLAIEQAGYPPEVVEHFETVIAEELERKGYRRAAEPDLLVNVAATILEEGDVSMQSDPYQAIHVQRGTFHDSWRGYGEGYGASSRRQRYGDGQINIGLVDMDDKVLLWEAVATGRISGQRTETERDEMIASVTRQMLADLPARR